MSQSLEGLLVVSLEQAVAAPYLSSRLADAGARVIKIERSEGDFARQYDSVVKGQSAYFVWLNRGKESVTLDIKQPDDLQILKNMVAKADVFIQNLAPGAAARLGLDSKQLRAADPRLITVDISGYGEDGPARDMKAYDMLVQAETGLASITGSPDAPGRVGVSVCDIAAGMHALAGVLEALYAREKTGRGCGVKSSLFAGMADWMTVPLLHQEYGGKAPGRVGLMHPSIAPYEAYDSADAGKVVISIQNSTEWRNLCRYGLEDESLADHEDFASNELRVKNRAALNQKINSVFGKLARREIVARLEKGRIAYGSLNSVEDLSHHPQLRRTPVETPSGEISLIASPIQFAGQKDSFGPVPDLGQQTDSIKQEFANPSGAKKT